MRQLLSRGLKFARYREQEILDDPKQPWYRVAKSIILIDLLRNSGGRDPFWILTPGFWILRQGGLRARRSDLGFGAAPQLDRAAEAGDVPTRGGELPPRLDRARVRGRLRGGHRPAAVVRPVPRQAQDWLLHDAGQGAERHPDAGQAAH